MRGTVSEEDLSCRIAAGPQDVVEDAAMRHCSVGMGIWTWASNDEGDAPDVVMACAGDVPTDAIDHAPRIRDRAGHVQQHLRDRLLEHRAYISRHGQDMPEIAGWHWIDPRDRS